jgi:hypothetical protein
MDQGSWAAGGPAATDGAGAGVQRPRDVPARVRTMLTALARVSQLHHSAHTRANAELVAEALAATEQTLAEEDRGAFPPDNDALVESIEACGLAARLPLCSDYLRGWRTTRPGVPGNFSAQSCPAAGKFRSRSQLLPQQYHNFGRRPTGPTKFAPECSRGRISAPPNNSGPKLSLQQRTDQSVPHLPGFSVPARGVASLSEAATPGLYWVADLETFVLQIEGNVRLVGNVCKIGRPCRDRVCADAACGRELVGCGQFHNPRLHGPPRDVRGLGLPHGRAAPRWLPSREEIPTVIGRKDAGDDLEAIAMHAVLVAALHKKYNRGLPSELA